jgi:glycosyltransferase involved in cell wall biosynthesis
MNPSCTGRPYVLALGTTEPRKDLPGLVAAFDRMAGAQPDLELRIAGPPGWGEDALGLAIASATHRDRIHRLGWVADRDALLAGATVFAYPSRYEGFGFPPLEAMAVGVPVVSTRTGAIPEVLGDAALLVPVGDVDALAGALERLVVDAEERRRLIAAGSVRVARYSWTQAGDGLADLYRRVAAG